MKWRAYKMLENLCWFVDTDEGERVTNICDVPRAEEYAILIAAAPDLLEALIEARRQLEAYEYAFFEETYNSIQINAAIAKATGDK